MNVQTPFVSPNQAPAAARLAYAVASWDECVSLMGDEDADTAAVLDQAERELSRKGIRCICVCGLLSNGLTSRGLMAQIMGRADSDTLTDGDLEAVFIALTEPGPGYDRVALLVSQAHCLLPSALRYIQFACQSSPKLLVVLTGNFSLATVLADDEFAYLRRRITRKLELPDPAANDAPHPPSITLEPLPPAPPPPVVLLPAMRPSATTTRRSSRFGTPVKLGLAASLAFVVWTTRWGGTPAPSVAVVQPDAVVARHGPAVMQTAPQVPVIGELPTQLEANKPVAAQADQRPAEAGSPALAGMQGAAEPAAPQQERVQATQPPTEALSLSAMQEPAPPVLAGYVSPPQQPASPIDPAVAAMQEQPAEPVQRTEHSTGHAPEQAVAAVGDQAPEAAASPIEQDVAPSVAALNSGRVADQTLEPPGAPATEAALPPNPTAGDNPEVSPPPLRLQTITVLAPAVTLEKARRARRGAEGNTAPVETPPIRSAEGARCRDIVLKAQLGEDPSDADKQFMYGRCRAK